MAGHRSWRSIADELAERLSHAAFCPDHPDSKEDPDNCPFCRDRAAYRNYLEKRRASGN